VVNQDRLQVGVAVVFAGLVMVVVLAKRRQPFQPFVNIRESAPARCRSHTRRR
jgi:hypothetical protein